jgi:hypothetical protein
MSEKIIKIIIHERREECIISGNADSLQALGEMLILKAKIGKNLLATFKDGVNKPIKVELDSI